MLTIQSVDPGIPLTGYYGTAFTNGGDGDFQGSITSSASGFDATYIAQREGGGGTTQYNDVNGYTVMVTSPASYLDGTTTAQTAGTRLATLLSTTAGTWTVVGYSDAGTVVSTSGNIVESTFLTTVSSTFTFPDLSPYGYTSEGTSTFVATTSYATTATCTDPVLTQIATTLNPGEQIVDATYIPGTNEWVWSFTGTPGDGAIAGLDALAAPLDGSFSPRNTAGTSEFVYALLSYGATTSYQPIVLAYGTLSWTSGSFVTGTATASATTGSQTPGQMGNEVSGTTVSTGQSTIIELSVLVPTGTCLESVVVSSGSETASSALSAVVESVTTSTAVAQIVFLATCEAQLSDSQGRVTSTAAGQTTSSSGMTYVYTTADSNYVLGPYTYTLTDGTPYATIGQGATATLESYVPSASMAGVSGCATHNVPTFDSAVQLPELAGSDSSNRTNRFADIGFDSCTTYQYPWWSQVRQGLWMPLTFSETMSTSVDTFAGCFSTDSNGNSQSVDSSASTNSGVSSYQGRTSVSTFFTYCWSQSSVSLTISTGPGSGPATTTSGKLGAANAETEVWQASTPWAFGDLNTPLVFGGDQYAGLPDVVQLAPGIYRYTVADGYGYGSATALLAESAQGSISVGTDQIAAIETVPGFFGQSGAGEYITFPKWSDPGL